MDLKDVYELLDKFDGSACCEMELNLNGMQLSLKKYSSIAVPSGLNNVVAGNTQTQAEQVTDNASAGDAIQIKAPLVGTFYQAPGPDEQPYVKVGQQVKKGDVVGIIEAMKLMNEVVAPQDGVILSIDATDGNMVQYGQVLFTMK
ncbi:MAG: acetyl-CoA carboxylase biotin carboxyl carrier protein [Clostridia bacterium]|nr:acetyl-CoA carboxylase biotin carboxyl carrier protein [Clostridia bacterium]